MEKAKKNYSKEKAAEYYLLNKEAIKKRHKNVTDEEKQAKNECQKNYFKKLKTYKEDLLLEKQKEVYKVANYYKKKKQVQKHVKNENKKSLQTI